MINIFYFKKASSKEGSSEATIMAAAAASASPPMPPASAGEAFEEMAEYQRWQNELKERRSFKELTKSREREILLR